MKASVLSILASEAACSSAGNWRRRRAGLVRCPEYRLSSRSLVRGSNLGAPGGLLCKPSASPVSRQGEIGGLHAGRPGAGQGLVRRDVQRITHHFESEATASISISIAGLGSACTTQVVRAG